MLTFVAYASIQAECLVILVKINEILKTVGFDFVIDPVRIILSKNENLLHVLKFLNFYRP